MKKKNVRLYNLVFPFWFLYLFPMPQWLILLPVNFAVDSLVIYLSAREQEIGNGLDLWKRSILSVWSLGFLCDFIGAALTFGLYLLLHEVPGMIDLITFPGTTLISIPGLILAGVLIYFLNKKFSFRKANLSPEQLHRLCLHLALFTAPYTMLIPAFL